MVADVWFLPPPGLPKYVSLLTYVGGGRPKPSDSANKSDKDLADNQNLAQWLGKRGIPMETFCELIKGRTPPNRRSLTPAAAANGALEQPITETVAPPNLGSGGGDERNFLARASPMGDFISQRASSFAAASAPLRFPPPPRQEHQSPWEEGGFPVAPPRHLGSVPPPRRQLSAPPPRPTPPLGPAPAAQPAAPSFGTSNPFMEEATDLVARAMACRSPEDPAVGRVVRTAADARLADFIASTLMESVRRFRGEAARQDQQQQRREEQQQTRQQLQQHPRQQEQVQQQRVQQQPVQQQVPGPAFERRFLADPKSSRGLGNEGLAAFNCILDARNRERNPGPVGLERRQMRQQEEEQPWGRPGAAFGGGGRGGPAMNNRESDLDDIIERLRQPNEDPDRVDGLYGLARSLLDVRRGGGSGRQIQQQQQQLQHQQQPFYRPPARRPSGGDGFAADDVRGEEVPGGGGGGGWDWGMGGEPPQKQYRSRYHDQN